MANVDSLLALRGIGSSGFCGPPDPGGSLSWVRPKDNAKAASSRPSLDRPLVVGDDSSNPWRPAASWAKANPIIAAFDEAALDRAMDEAHEEREKEANKAAVDISDFLIEKHLWTDGLTPAMLQQECTATMISTHARLLRRFANPADLSKSTGHRLDGRAKLLLQRVAKSVTADLSSGEAWTTLRVEKPDGGAGLRYGVGDKSGLFYYLGTKCGASTEYENPTRMSPQLLQVQQKSQEGTYWDYGGGETLIDNGNESRCMTYRGGNSTPQVWITATIKADGVKCMPTHYKLRFYNADSAPAWEFQGSNDEKEWTTIATQTDERPRENLCKTWEVPPSAPFNSFRLLGAGPGMRFTLINWEIYGHIFDNSTPSKLVSRAIALGKKARPPPPPTPAAVMTGATFAIGLRMLERLIKLEGGVAEDDGLAAYALAVLRDALKQLSPSSLVSPNTFEQPVPSDLMDAAAGFLLRCCGGGTSTPAGPLLAPDSPPFAMAVQTVGLLATRRGRLRDYFCAIDALSGSAQPACCAIERDELLRRLKRIACAQYLDTAEDAVPVASPTLSGGDDPGPNATVSSAGGFWEFDDGRRGWKVIGAEFQAQLEEGRAAFVNTGSSSITIGPIGRFKYLIEFESMTQTNTETGKRRKIRKSGTANSVANDGITDPDAGDGTFCGAPFEPEAAVIVLKGLVPLLEEILDAAVLDRESTAVCRLATANLACAAYTMETNELVQSGPVAARLVDLGKQLFDLPLLPAAHSEVRNLLGAATELFAESNGDANALLDLALSAAAPAGVDEMCMPGAETTQAATGSTAFVAQALLANIDTVNKAVGVCGPHSAVSSVRNLEDHATVIAVARRLIVAAQAATNAAFSQSSKGGKNDADGEPPAAGMIGIVAKLQAGIWAHHHKTSTAESAKLVSRYTAMLLGIATRTVDECMNAGSKGIDLDVLAARLRSGPVEGLLPAWVVVLHAEQDWGQLSAEALNSVECFLKSWAAWSATISPAAKLVRGSSRSDELRDALRAGQSRLATAVCSIVDKDSSGGVDSDEVSELSRQLSAARGEHKALLTSIAALLPAHPADAPTEHNFEPQPEQPEAEAENANMHTMPIDEFRDSWTRAEAEQLELKFEDHKSLFRVHARAAHTFCKLHLL